MALPRARGRFDHVTRLHDNLWVSYRPARRRQPQPMNPLHPLVADVTARIRERSRGLRNAYLERVDALRRRRAEEAEVIELLPAGCRHRQEGARLDLQTCKADDLFIRVARVAAVGPAVLVTDVAAGGSGGAAAPTGVGAQGGGYALEAGPAVRASPLVLQ